VRGDADQLRILLTNLVENALRHVPPGRGVIDVKAGLADDGRPLLQVVDNGPGIPPAERERVFDRFYRGEHGAGTQGSGLGLAIVKAVAQRHRAEVSLHDAPGGGLDVRVRF
jgi:two-component system OmpR family sensor kinase/two-component system sensor histidine kinase QseC